MRHGRFRARRGVAGREVRRAAAAAGRATPAVSGFDATGQRPRRPAVAPLAWFRPGRGRGRQPVLRPARRRQPRGRHSVYVLLRRRRDQSVADSRTILRGYSWVTVCGQELADRLGGVEALRATRAFHAVERCAAEGSGCRRPSATRTTAQPRSPPCSAPSPRCSPGPVRQAAAVDPSDLPAGGRGRLNRDALNVVDIRHPLARGL
jgi:hypothetical protein